MPNLKEQIRDSKPALIAVAIPEFGDGPFHIKQMTAQDNIALDKYNSDPAYSQRLICRLLTDAEGNRVLTDDELCLLDTMPVKVVMRLLDAINGDAIQKKD